MLVLFTPKYRACEEEGALEPRSLGASEQVSPPLCACSHICGISGCSFLLDSPLRSEPIQTTSLNHLPYFHLASGHHLLVLLSSMVYSLQSISPLAPDSRIPVDSQGFPLISERRLSNCSELLMVLSTFILSLFPVHLKLS